MLESADLKLSSVMKPDFKSIKLTAENRNLMKLLKVESESDNLSMTSMNLLSANMFEIFELNSVM